MDWDDIRFFLAIARANPLSGAAKQLNVSQPSAELWRELEEESGTSLLTTNGAIYVAPPDHHGMIWRCWQSQRFP